MRVLGRESDESGGCEGSGESTVPTGRLGHYRARDGSTGGPVGLDLDRPHVVLVVGKRGYGKSYTLGVVAEELARARGVSPVVADPMGVFGPLAAGDLSGRELPAAVPADALSPRAWCRLVGLSPESGAGALVWQAASEATTLAGMQTAVAESEGARDARRAASNHLAMAADWEIWESEVAPPDGDGGCSVLDLAGLDPAPANAVVGAVATQLYDRRTAGASDHLPWLLLDEAHAFTDGVAAGPLERLVTRGRQPGVSLVMATQRPDALPEVAISQADLLVVHRLTDRRDREALAAARPSYLTASLADRMPTEPGEALVVDDTTESVHTVAVRERETRHAGDTPRASAGERASKTT